MGLMPADNTALLKKEAGLTEPQKMVIEALAALWGVAVSAQAARWRSNCIDNRQNAPGEL